MMLGSGIYQIRNLINGKVYVGSAVCLKNRFKLHHINLRKGNHHSSHLQRAWDKHGVDNFVFEVLEGVLDKEYLIAREQYWIDKLHACRDGYNTCPVAGSTLGTKRSEQTREKLKNCFKGRKHTEASKLAISLAKKGVPAKPRSDATRRLLSKINKGKVLSAATCAKISQAKKGTRHSEETKKRMSIAQLNIPRDVRERMNRDNTKRGFTSDGLRRLSEAATGRTPSIETRKRLSVAATGRKLSADTIAKRQATRARNALAQRTTA